MIRTSLAVLIVVILGIVTGAYLLVAAENVEEKDCFFLSSLHHTTRGMGYWYDRRNGGFESLTGIPYDSLACKHCHAPGCDACHKKETDGKLSYSTDSAKDQKLCLSCHTREKKMMKIDQERNEMDVHFAEGMGCTDCHTAGEVHGDGTEYNSMRQQGAMETECEDCHAEVYSSASHTVHGDKLSCSACHTRRVVTCYSCHFEDYVTKDGLKTSIPITDWSFLVNYQEQVTSGNLLATAYQGKTFVTYAPFFSHSVMKQGRSCSECHGTEIARRLNRGKLKLTWVEKGELQSAKGVIPIAEGKLDLVFLEHKDGEWLPIKNAPAPMVQYSAYGTPISDEQLKKLAQKVGKERPGSIVFRFTLDVAQSHSPKEVD